MEADVHSYEDILLKSYVALSEDERVLWKEVKREKKNILNFH